MSGRETAENIRAMLDGESVAIVGGTTWEEEGHKEPLRSSDREALDSENIDIDETVEAVYGVPGEKLVEAVGERNVYVTGGTIANPFSRLLNTDIEPEEVNTIEFGNLVSARRFPFTFDAEGTPGRQVMQDEKLMQQAAELVENTKDYSELTEFEQALAAYAMPAEEFRTNEVLRPNYVIDRSYDDDGAEVLNEFETIWVPQDGEITELEEVQKEEYLSKRFTPVANGNDWQTDYAILGVHENPYGDGNIVAAQGAHHLATSGANSLLTYPESTDLDIQDNEAVLEAIGDFQEETGAEQYQAVIQTYRNPSTGETRNNLVAIGELE